MRSLVLTTLVLADGLPGEELALDLEEEAKSAFLEDGVDGTGGGVGLRLGHGGGECEGRDGEEREELHVVVRVRSVAGGVSVAGEVGGG